jgi:hypothetical protein
MGLYVNIFRKVCSVTRLEAFVGLRRIIVIIITISNRVADGRPGLSPRQGQFFSYHHDCPAPYPVCIQEYFPGIKQPEREAEITFV